MSTLDNPIRPTISNENLNLKYEKCRHITEEIYKRINITFEIKKLAGTQSDLSDQSDQIDSNELSNETDLFACDKSDSIPSSTEAERPPLEKYININNNEETKAKSTVAYKRPRKRFRKRVKKRQSKPVTESDGSSDEALPLSRVVNVATASPDHVGVPNILVLTKDVKPKILAPDKQKKTTKKKDTKSVKEKIKESKDVGGEKIPVVEFPVQKIEEKIKDMAKICSLCNMEFTSDRGVRKHMAVAHGSDSERFGRPEREVKPA